MGITGDGVPTECQDWWANSLTLEPCTDVAIIPPCKSPARCNETWLQDPQNLCPLDADGMYTQPCIRNTTDPVYYAWRNYYIGVMAITRSAMFLMATNQDTNEVDMTHFK